MTSGDAKATTTQGSPESRMAQVSIESVVRTIQKVYLFFAVMGVLGVPVLLLRSSGALPVLQDIFLTLLYSAVYFGLRRRKEWVITLVLIFSALCFVQYFFDIMHPADGIKALLAKVVVLLLLSFYAYQIHFFSRADVRERFGDKGILVI
jgi:hypothetical protein